PYLSALSLHAALPILPPLRAARAPLRDAPPERRARRGGPRAARAAAHRREASRSRGPRARADRLVRPRGGPNARHRDTPLGIALDRKSTRLNSSHVKI